MIVASMVIMMMVAKNPNLITLAISILFMSILVAPTMFKITGSSWLAYVTILTFSSGMMTLFIYVASMSANEKNKNKKNLKNMMPAFTLTLFTLKMNINSSTQKESMKMFSMKFSLMMMMMVILITMLTISSHGHHPNQTLASSF